MTRPQPASQHDEVEWLDRFFASYYRHRPVNATFVGLHDWDHLLPDLSEGGAGDTLADMEGLLADAGQLSADTRVPPSDGREPDPFVALDRRLAEGFLKIQLWEHRSNHFHRGNPSLYVGEAIFGVMSLFLSDFAPLHERIEAATARMAAVPTLLSQGQENVRAAPEAWTRRALRECKGALAFLTGGIEHVVAELVDSGSGADPALASAFRRAAGNAADAFRSFQAYLELALLQHETDGWACGEEALSTYLREGHFLAESPDEIVAYAEGAMAEAVASLQSAEVNLERVTDELAQLHSPIHEYYGRYQELWDQIRDTAETQSLLTWPDFPIRYGPRPAWSRESAPYLYFLFYRSPAAYNRPPVHEYLVTPIDEGMPPERQEELLQANNDSVIKLNHVIHHGSIGHHVQNWHAFRSPSRVGRIAAVDCASRIAMFCGGTMAEGWACYATDLMSEAGALTPLERIAELKGRARMCSRAIVDMRLHQGQFTLEEAEDFYVKHAGMPPGAAHSEAVKNSMFPGAAIIYLMGTDAIHDLRAEMSGRLGSEFNLKGFHDEFLSHGSIPVALIAEQMRGSV